MRQENYSLAEIGLLQLVKIPWLVKFLWAPFIDNNSHSRKQLFSWIFFSELFYAAVILGTGLLDLQTDFRLIIFLMIIAFIASATQDIAVDIFAIRILRPEDRSLGNSMQSAGSLTGTLFGTGILLIAYFYFGWTTLLVLLSLFVLFALLPLLFYRNPPLKEDTPRERITLIEALKFFQSQGRRKRIPVLIFYYSGIIGILTLLKPYLVDLGYNAKQIGIMSGVFGTSAGALSAFAGGLFIKKAGRRKSMFFFLFLSLSATILFIIMSLAEPSKPMLLAGIGLLWGAYGASTVLIYTTSMDLVRPGCEGTDFTFQIVITHLSSMVIAVLSGKAGDLIGYTGVFIACSVLCMLTFPLVVYSNPTIKNNADIS
jgi:predicted MFS family arabinose efflux permease